MVWILETRLHPDIQMRLIQLVESAATGAGRHVVDLTEGLLARGHEVHLAYSPLRSDAVFRADLHRLGSKSGFHAFELPMRREPSPMDLGAIRTLRRYARSRGPFELVHCHSSKAGFIGRVGVRGLPVKRIYTPHMFFSLDPTRSAWIRRASGAVEAMLSKFGEGIVVVSSQEYRHARGLGIAAGKLRLIPNGVSIDQPPLSNGNRCTIRRTLGIADEETCIGFVGRLVPVKSPQTMIEAFAGLRRRCDAPTRLLMVGDGPLLGALRGLTAELRIEASVSWLGECDAKALMGAFDVLALTSDSEGHPLVVLEAMACGLPVVATAVGGVPDTVQDGVNGFITPVRGVAEIAAALETLVNNRELRQRMGQASLALAQNFSVDRMVDQTIAFYEQILSGSRKESAALDLKSDGHPYKGSHPLKAPTR